MALVASIIMTGISIGLLVIYGADVAAGGGGAGEGFLPLDAKARGLGLGIPSVVLPIISFFISRKEPSKILGVMIVISGILILVGGITSIGISDPEQVNDTGRNIIAEGASLVAVGAFIVALGSIKLKKS